MSKLDLINTYGNKIWRMQHLYKIRDKKHRATLLKFNKAQQRIVDQIITQKPVRQITVKSRQMGVSTLMVLWWLDETIWNKNTLTGILAHKWESLDHIWSIVEFAFKHYPEALKPTIGQESARALEFSDINSKIFISLSIRSTGIHNLHISEWCFCKDEEVRATLGSISPYTNVSGESTGNGVANDGYQTYQDALLGENEYKHLFLPWFIQNEYKLPLNEQNPDQIVRGYTDEERAFKDKITPLYGVSITPEQMLWRRQAKKRLKDLFRQEYPETDTDAFITSGHHFFNMMKVMELLREAKTYQEKVGYFERTDRYSCFEEPQPRDVYVAGADTAEGGDDYCVLKIINLTKRREAFVYRSKCGVKTFYIACDKWCRKYNNAYLAVESNSCGQAVLLGLQEDCRYPNLYRETSATRVLSKMSDKPKVKYGWRTTAQSRQLILSELKYFIEDEDDISVEDFAPEYAVYDIDLLKEMLTFINKDGKYEAEAGKHDDDIIASAIATQMFKKLRPMNARTSSVGTGIKLGTTYEAGNLY